VTSCLTNHFRDWAIKNNGTQNEFGYTANFEMHDTWTLDAVPCDPERPEKCPKNKPICMRNEVMKINENSSQYKGFN